HDERGPVKRPARTTRPSWRREPRGRNRRGAAGSLRGTSRWDRTPATRSDFAPPVEASMKRFLLLLAVAALVMPSAAVAQTVPLKLATIVGNDNPFTTSAYKFKQVAEAEGGGRSRVEG